MSDTTIATLVFGIGAAGFVGTTVVYGYRRARGDSFDGFDFLFAGYMGSMLWPLVVIAFAAFGSFKAAQVPGRLAALAVKRLQSRKQRAIVKAAVQQPPMGPHRTARCEACGRAFADKDQP